MKIKIKQLKNIEDFDHYFKHVDALLEETLRVMEYPINGNDATHVVFEDVRFIGAFKVSSHESCEKSLRLAWIAISKRFQRQGFGKYILQKIIEDARKNNIKNLFLSVRKSNHKALHLYKIFGFQPIPDKTSNSNEQDMKLIILKNK